MKLEIKQRLTKPKPREKQNSNEMIHKSILKRMYPPADAVAINCKFGFEHVTSHIPSLCPENS